MARVITSIAFDLKFNVLFTPPACSVAFTDIAADSHESPGRVTFTDADATTMWTAVDKIAAANALLDARATALPDLPTIAARMTAVDDLDRQLREKKAANDAADAQLAQKQAALTAADEQFTTKQAAIAALDVAPVAEATPLTVEKAL